MRWRLVVGCKHNYQSRMARRNLDKAKVSKKDEFYTQLTDIERELQHYWPHFRDKVVLCNCDDPYESNFFKYFALRFNQLGLKKLICTCYNGSPVQGNELMIDFGDGFGEPKKIAYKVEITEVKDLNGDGAVDLSDVRYLLQNDKNVLSILKTGDFRDPECIELLKQADIVVTNPPFSLFREYIGQLMEYDKKFLIIGSQNNVTYKEVFQLIMTNKIWLGYKSGDMAFKVPSDYEARETRYWEDETGQKWRSLGNICWFTNLDHNKRHEELDLVCHYSSEEYPTYDNYAAINVNKVDEIPVDYDGIMGVPITFFDKYNPNQFEILGMTTGRDEFIARPTKRYVNPIQINKDGSRTNGSKANTRATLLLPNIPSGRIYYVADNSNKPFEILYARILIRNKKPRKL
jgi:hypothetical protein